MNGPGEIPGRFAFWGAREGGEGGFRAEGAEERQRARRGEGSGQKARGRAGRGRAKGARDVEWAEREERVE